MTNWCTVGSLATNNSGILVRHVVTTLTSITATFQIALDGGAYSRSTGLATLHKPPHSTFCKDTKKRCLF